MLGELVIKFLLGGIVVTVFSTLGNVFKPNSFAGLFGAAPSVSIATLALTFSSKGAGYVSTEGRSMVIGAFAMAIYSVVCAWVIKHEKLPTWMSAGMVWIVWLAAAFGLRTLVVAP